jgi:hypothetical protein
MHGGGESLGRCASDEPAGGENFSSPGHTEGASQRSAWLREISAGAGRSPQALESRGRRSAGTSEMHAGRVENDEQSVWSGMLQEMFREKESLIGSLKSSRAREEAAVRDQKVLEERVRAAEEGRECAERALMEYKESQKKFLREKQVVFVAVLSPSLSFFPFRKLRMLAHHPSSAPLTLSLSLSLSLSPSLPLSPSSYLTQTPCCLKTEVQWLDLTSICKRSSSTEP